MSPFGVLSQVGNLGCIEFLNRESQVRFLPGALRSFRRVFEEQTVCDLCS
jgi:hypothetical protein